MHDHAATATSEPVSVEQRKSGDVKGRYLHPVEHRQQPTKGIEAPRAARPA
jgi:hypothetical protein